MRGKPSKFVLSLAILFLIGQLFFTIKGVQTLPFINYGMYSSPQNLSKTFTNFEIKVNDETVNPKAKNCINQDILNYNIRFYDNLLSNNFEDATLTTINSRLYGKLSQNQLNYVIVKLINDESSHEYFAEWLKRYFENLSEKEIDEISISKNTYHWNGTELEFVASLPIFNYEY